SHFSIPLPRSPHRSTYALQFQPTFPDVPASPATDSRSTRHCVADRAHSDRTTHDLAHFPLTNFSPDPSCHRLQQWPPPKNRRRQRRLPVRAAPTLPDNRFDPRAKHLSKLFTCLTHLFVDARNLL